MLQYFEFHSAIEGNDLFLPILSYEYGFIQGHPRPEQLTGYPSDKKGNIRI